MTALHSPSARIGELMEKPVRRTYSYADFHDWREAGTLSLTPG